MIEQYSLLICLQGVEESRPALEYGLNLAKLMRCPVTVLAISGRARDPEDLEKQAQEALDELEKVDLPHDLVRASGPVVRALPTLTRIRPYFTVFNFPPQSLWRKVAYGGRFRRLLATMQGPLLRVSTACWPIRRVLVCTGGLSYAGPTETVATELAKLSGAHLAFLHVVPPVSLDYELAQKVAHNWQHLLEMDTPQSRHLKEALERAEGMGVKAEVIVRHGQIVDEILREIGSGGYDLVGMGSPYASRSLHRMYSPNVTAEVAADVDCPLLTVH